MKPNDRIRARRSLFAESNDHAVIRGLRDDVDGELDFDPEPRDDGVMRTVFDRSRWTLRRWPMSDQIAIVAI